MEPKKILVVDDHLGVREITAMMVAKICPNAEIFQAEDGKSGYAQVNAYQPDLVITDYEMPRINGLQFLCNIKENYPDTIVIMASGNDDKALIDLAMRRGASYFFLKPVSLVQLKESISKI